MAHLSGPRCSSLSVWVSCSFRSLQRSNASRSAGTYLFGPTTNRPSCRNRNEAHMGKIGVRSFMAGLIGLALVTGSGVAQAAEDKLSMRLDWQLTGYQVPFYWAKAKGYYKDGNLDVDIKSGSGSGLTINLVGSQQDDLGFADYLLMATAVAKGMNVKAIYGVVQDGAWAVISHADQPIRV